MTTFHKLLLAHGDILYLNQISGVLGKRNEWMLPRYSFAGSCILTSFCPFEIKFKSNYTSIQVLSKGHFNAVPSRGDSQLNL